MKELWRKTADIFWQHPIVWLPVIAADLMGFFVIQIQTWVTRSLIVWLVARSHRSVLGGVPEPMTNAESLGLTFLLAPLSWARYLICILLYIAAYFVVARFVYVAIDGDRIKLSWRWAKKQQVVIFAVKMLILCAGTFALIMWVLSLSGGNNLLKTSTSIWAFSFVVSFVVVYIMMPSGLLLLSPDAFKSDALRKLKLSRISGLLAAFTSVVIGAFCSQVAEASAARNHVGSSLWMQAVGSLLTALPYCPLFIALSLLVFEAMPEEAAD